MPKPEMKKILNYSTIQLFLFKNFWSVKMTTNISSNTILFKLYTQ